MIFKVVDDSLVHLKDVNMTYLEHMYFSLNLSFNLFLTSMKGVVHAIIPGYFTTSISDYSEELREKLKRI